MGQKTYKVEMLCRDRNDNYGNKIGTMSEFRKLRDAGKLFDFLCEVAPRLSALCGEEAVAEIDLYATSYVTTEPDEYNFRDSVPKYEMLKRFNTKDMAVVKIRPKRKEPK